VDDHHFDTWVRAWGGQRSRRRVLRGLLGGGALLLGLQRGRSEVAARRGTAGPGDPCRHDDQCLAADTALVCAWNGFDYDGDLNCCAYQGGRCGNDNGCCGYSSCLGGFCGPSDDFSASAGNGGFATASADGGTVFIGDVNSGGNTGNVISVGNTQGGVQVSGGSVSNSTNISASADGGMAIADAGGGSGNIAGGGGDYGTWNGCTGEGCACWQGTYDDNPCDWGLVCCLNADSSGVCITQYACTGFGVPGDVCPRYCGAGNSCLSCVSGYCTWDNYCA